MRRVLITGATGGLGLALVRELAGRGHHVVATGRLLAQAARIEGMRARFAALDLADPSADLAALLQGCDSVIHAAALSASWGPVEAFEAMNVGVTRRLLDAARASGAGRFVFVSSPSVFADFRDRMNIGEHDRPTLPPLNHYARTKLAAERLVLAANGAALHCCAIRPRGLVGDGDRVILPRLAQMARRPRLPLPRGGQALIELTDLRDAAWAIAEAEERAPAIGNRAINISGGQPVRVADLAAMLAEAMGTTPRLVSVPSVLARPLASALELAARLTGREDEPVLTRYTLATMGYSQTFDLAPAHRLLGYAPRRDALGTLLAQARELSRELSRELAA